MTYFLTALSWVLGSVCSAELVGYWLHRLLHSGVIAFLSRNHMKHHLVLYGPFQHQRSAAYQHATEDSVSLGNIGLEWLAPSVLLMAGAVAMFWFLNVRLLYQLIYFVVTLGWSFLMFSWLHDVLHVEGTWLERSRLLRRWFLSARSFHDIHHHTLNKQGLMDKNFGIGFFFFDRIFGTLAVHRPECEEAQLSAAKERFSSLWATLEQKG